MASKILRFPGPDGSSAILAQGLRPSPVGDLQQQSQHLALNAEDGTLQLLRSGFLVAGVAALCAALALLMPGGVGPEGPRTNLGWLALIVALMSMPFGLLLLLLGGAKWLRNHALSSRGQRWPQGVLPRDRG